MKSLLPLLFSVLLLCGVSAADLRKVAVIQTTDIHAQTDGRRTPGIARLATVLKTERENAGGSSCVLLIDCGDLTQGSYGATLDQGASLIRYLNLLSYDVFVPGNHDFDFGTSALIRRLSEFRGVVLGMNFRLDGLPEKRILKWKMLEKNGLRIAVIGMTSPHLKSWLGGAQTDGLTMLDHETELARIMPEILRSNPDLIVLAMHHGEFAPRRLDPQADHVKKRFWSGSFLRKYPQIDLVLGGHTHQSIPGGKLANSWYGQAPPLSGGAVVAEIVYDREARRVVSLQSRVVSAANAVPDPEIQSMLVPLAEQSRKEGTRKIARLPFPLLPLAKKETSNRLSELFGNAMMRAAGAKIAFHGTLSSYRAQPGILYASQLYLLAPYENELCTIDLTPAECRAIIEEQYAVRKPGTFQAVHGVAFRMGSGGRIEGGLFLNGESGEWKEERRTVTAAFSGYTLAGAGGRFPVLREIGERKKPLFRNRGVRSALGEYLTQEYPVKTR